MEVVNISEFKKRYLTILERVEKTRQPILITRRGKTIAKIMAVSGCIEKTSWLGSMSSTGVIVGDIVKPVLEETTWEIFRN